MYSSDDTQQRARHAEGRARVCELEARSDDQPLTALEQLELSTRYATFAVALQRTRDTWANARPSLGAAYESLIRGYLDASARHEALATIAPAHDRDDPFERRR